MPVGIAAVTGYFVAHAFDPLSLGVVAGRFGDVLGHDLAVAALLGVFAATFGIGIMRVVAWTEALLTKIKLRRRCVRRWAGCWSG